MLPPLLHLLLFFFLLLPFSSVSATQNLVTDHCSITRYPELCASAISTFPNLSSMSLPAIISSLIKRTVHEVHFASSNCTGSLRRPFRSIQPIQRVALLDCLELLSDTLDFLNDALSDLSSSPNSTGLPHLQTVLSAVITNQYTCLDGFADASPHDTLRPSLEARLNHISSMVSNSLALTNMLPRRKRLSSPAFYGYGSVRNGFPSWISRKDRRLLQTNVSSLTPNLVVAKDGSGNFSTIGDAVAAAPNGSTTRFVIYIKAGGYFENVEVPKSKTNLTFIGDGMWKTIVKGNRSVVDGWTTFRSATVAVGGNGFLARDMSFENTAGPSKHQAVALRSSADLSAFYRCGFAGYQDTLYVHSLRQFYRECDIYGTVDFIFGDAAVVFQKCNLYARKPDTNQKNIFTAQGREDPNQNTGISLQGCKIAAASDLLPVQSNFSSYLGRPWKLYSRTIVMQSQIDSLIHPAGWLEWNGTVGLDTLYYREYMNFGPGANTSLRVAWPGYRATTNATEVLPFTTASFIQADQWLPATAVPYSSGFV